ncbi:MAG: PfkB family carbohydrate kinase [Gammaproteobacteria bacterium]|nr:PfkB family carbohydrate kinase [Gammaproteobacteria bacterium]
MCAGSVEEAQKHSETKHHTGNTISSDTTKHKIHAFETIRQTLAEVRAHKTVVQCHGVFDLLHIGHIKHLQQAKSLGDILVVTVTANHFVNKGPGKPYFSEHLRAEALAALDCVDFVVINHHATSIKAIHEIKPNLYVKGVEYQCSENDITGKILDEAEAVKSAGGTLFFTEDIVFSSSTLLNKYFPLHTPEINAYLETIKKSYHINDILTFCEKMQDMKVLVIGEAIVDIYHFGEAIGKSGKEPVLVTKYHREEMYAGGILAVANHISSFCSEVHCITMLGENGDYEGFIRENVKENVGITFHYKKNSPTPVKRRYIEEYSSQKLFEIYEIDDYFFEQEQQQALMDSISETIENYDLVIVTDYGHGLLDSECIELIESKAKFLAVNTQANAGNHGFNCISKYKKADFVCIANRELQLNFRQKHITVTEQMQQLMSDFDYKNVIVTSGVRGSYVCKAGEDIVTCPSLTVSVKDRVGAGDAVLAITSLFMAQQASSELTGFLSNVVGAEAVHIMGNKSSIEKASLLKHITHLMK